MYAYVQNKHLLLYLLSIVVGVPTIDVLVQSEVEMGMQGYSRSF